MLSLCPYHICIGPSSYDQITSHETLTNNISVMEWILTKLWIDARANGQCLDKSATSDYMTLSTESSLINAKHAD